MIVVVVPNSPAVEEVIQPDIKLLLLEVFDDSPHVVGTMQAAQPAMSCCVQAVSIFEVVCIRQHVYKGIHKPGWIHSCMVWIPGRVGPYRIGTIRSGRSVQKLTKHTGIAQNTVVRGAVRIRCRRYRITSSIDHLSHRGGAGSGVRVGVAIVPVVIVTEYAFAPELLFENFLSLIIFGTVVIFVRRCYKTPAKSDLFWEFDYQTDLN